MAPARLEGAAAISGALLLLFGTMLHPMQADPSDAVAAFTEYAADANWVASHLCQFFGIALMFVGLIGVGGAITGEAGEWIARVAVFFAASALALSAALQAVDGVALKTMVDDWFTAPADRNQAAFTAAFAVRQIEIGLASFVAMLFGVTAVLYGVAMSWSKQWPRWLGGLGVIGGLGTFTGGVLSATTGFSALQMNVSMPFNLTVIIWMILAGVILWRQAREP